MFIYKHPISLPERYTMGGGVTPRTRVRDDNRITVGIVDSTINAVSWLVEHTGLSKTNLVNRGLRLLHFVEQGREHGKQLAFVDRHTGSVELIHIL